MNPDEALELLLEELGWPEGGKVEQAYYVLEGVLEEAGYL